MRTITIADSLFPKTRQGILAAIFTQPDRWWYMRELSRHLHSSPSSLQRELDSLVRGGILRQKREGKHVYFQALRESPIFLDLQGIILKTVGLADVLRRLLGPFFESIEFAFVYGSIARSEEHATSDIDLMIIGNVPLADISPALRKAEDVIGRPVNVVVYSHATAAKKYRADHHFVKNVMESKKIFIKGDSDELVKAFGR